jgi:hypothetical protein
VLSALAQEETTLTRSLYDQTLADPFDEAIFDRFLRSSTSVTIEGRNYYVLEGDLPLTKEQVRARLLFQAQGSQPATTPSGELLVVLSDGKPAFWPKAARTLTYAVHRSSFPSAETYQLVCANLSSAAQEWEQVCPECGLTIQHRADFDAAPTSGNTTFVVAFVPTLSRGYVALSFFPNDPPTKRVLMVGPAYINTSYDKVGVFRHELGHILGYLHEHIRGNSGCYRDQDNQWQPLTKYDPHSVMHYFCGGTGTMTLNLTDSDKQGHRTLYQ